VETATAFPVPQGNASHAAIFPPSPALTHTLIVSLAGTIIQSRLPPRVVYCIYTLKLLELPTSKHCPGGGSGVWVGVLVGVWVGVRVSGGVAVAVGVPVLVGVIEGVNVFVEVGVGVSGSVAVGVGVGVFVGVSGGVAVIVGVWVGVIGGVAVGVAVEAGVWDGVVVAVGVGVCGKHPPHGSLALTAAIQSTLELSHGVPKKVILPSIAQAM
jgi:hypothetical protein